MKYIDDVDCIQPKLLDDVLGALGRWVDFRQNHIATYTSTLPHNDIGNYQSLHIQQAPSRVVGALLLVVV